MDLKLRDNNNGGDLIPLIGKQFVTNENLIRNGNFVNTDYWTIYQNAEIINGYLHPLEIINPNGCAAEQILSSDLVAGREYILEFDIQNYVSGVLRFIFIQRSNGNQQQQIAENISGNGIKKISFIPSGNQNTLYIYMSTGLSTLQSYRIDNIYLHETNYYTEGTKDFSIVNGFENMPYLAMFGGNVGYVTPNLRIEGEQAFDFWGNSLFGNNKKIQINSVTEKTLMDVSLNSNGRVEIENAIKTDLAFMKDFADVNVSTSIVEQDRLEIGIKLIQPDNLQDREFKFIWDATNNELINDNDTNA